MTKASFMFDGFTSAHKIAYVYYLSEILADKKCQNFKKL